MTLLPRTLFGRNALLILGLISFAQISGLLVFRELVQRPRTVQLADLAADYVSGVVDGLEALPAQDRRTFLRSFLNSKKVLMVPVEERGPNIARVTNPLWQQYARVVAERLHKSAQEVVWSSDYQGSLWIRVPIAEDQYWMVVRGLSAGSALSGLTVMVSALIIVLAMTGAFLIQRRINRPLRRLVESARQLANGQQTRPIPEEPPQEIATVTRAFNQMSSSLAAIDHERSVMLAGVSHDLRTPLSKVRLAIEIMEERIEPQILESLRNSMRQIGLIIDQFMEYGRTSVGEALEPVDVNELIRECVVHRDATEGVPELSLSPLPTMHLQRRALIRALSNLLDNAARYGAAPISIRSQALDSMVSISVIDSGQGIPPSELESMRQPFRRGSAARGGIPGSGLGLAIVARVAHAHGGDLRLINRSSGAGLEATIELPTK